MASTLTKTKAIKALDNMSEIVQAEMLTRGTYITGEIYDPTRIKALCGGHKVCAIGALWLGAGIKTKKIGSSSFYLPGVEEDNRDDFLRHRSGLRLAYDSLNEAAKNFAHMHGIVLRGYDGASIEALFEGHYERDYQPIDRQDLLNVIQDAKRLIEA